MPRTVLAFLLALPLLAQAPYAPTRESLSKRPTPAWFNQAKFGIFIVWGPYSVPGWAPKGKYAEWYGNRVETARRKNDSTDPWLAYHSKVYGRDFPYSGFVDLFKAEMFDADRWADLIARSGARYIVHTAKYHDGFALWPSKEATQSWGRPWNSVDTGPRRDLVGELDQAVRKRGIRSGLYYSVYEWFNPLYLADYRRYRDEHHIPQFKDLVTRYKPDLIWLDGQWDHSFEEWRSGELAAWLYNESPVKDFVAVNERWGGKRAMDPGMKEPVVGFKTSEYESGFDRNAGTWEESRGMGASYGYNRNEDAEDYRSGKQLIRLLVEVSSQGGNLLLDIGPTADGRIPVEMQERLLEIGAWLKVNGEAIYGSSAGPAQPASGLTGGAKPDHALTPAEEEVQSRSRTWATTSKPGKVYLHLLDWPANGRLELPAKLGQIQEAKMLDGGRPVAVSTTTGKLTLKLQGCAPPLMPAVVELRLR